MTMSVSCFAVLVYSRCLAPRRVTPPRSWLFLELHPTDLPHSLFISFSLVPPQKIISIGLPFLCSSTPSAERGFRASSAREDDDRGETTQAQPPRTPCPTPPAAPPEPPRVCPACNSRSTNFTYHWRVLHARGPSRSGGPTPPHHTTGQRMIDTRITNRRLLSPASSHSVLRIPGVIHTNGLPSR